MFLSSPFTNNYLYLAPIFTIILSLIFYKKFNKICNWKLIGITCFILFTLCFISNKKIKLTLSAISLVFFLSLFVKSIFHSKKLFAPAIFSLLSFLGLIFSVEIGLKTLPSKYYQKHIALTPPLAPRDRSEKVYKTNSFRGDKPIANPGKENVRIFTLGGSSTYGIPLFYKSHTYPKILEKILNERKPNNNYEVLNAGIAGHGITQIAHALKEVVLKHKPDIVTINEWFNDSSSIPGWYGIPSKSDREAYQERFILWKLQDWTPYKIIHNSKVFAFSRHYLLDFSKKLLKKEEKITKTDKNQINKPRASDKEYIQTLKELTKIADENNFLLALIYEPLHRSRKFKYLEKKNAYYKRISELRDSLDIPVISPIEELRNNHDALLFMDFIHPNAEGQRIIAESIYEQLFQNPISKKAIKFLKSKNILLNEPKVFLEKSYIFERDKINNKTISFSARAPYSKVSAAKLKLKTKNIDLESDKTLGKDFKTFKFKIPDLKNVKPLVDFKLAAEFSENSSSAEIGSTESRIRRELQVVSGGKDYGWQVSIKIDGNSIAGNCRGYNVAVFDGKTGKILANPCFDTFKEKANFLKLNKFLQTSSLKQFYNQKNPPIIVLAVKTDGFENISNTFSETLKSLGGTGKTPKRFESFALIGSPGAKPGTGIEEFGKKLVEIKVGKPKMWKESLIEVRDILVTSNNS